MAGGIKIGMRKVRKKIGLETYEKRYEKVHFFMGLSGAVFIGPKGRAHVPRGLRPLSRGPRPLGTMRPWALVPRIPWSQGAEIFLIYLFSYL